MMKDLFAPSVHFSPLPMPDADVSFLDHLEMPQDDRHIFEKLRADTPWLHEEVFVWGRRHLQPRLTAWYGDPGKSYTYSGTAMTPLPWTNLLLSLRRELEQLTEVRFNSVLLNFYRDHND